MIFWQQTAWVLDFVCARSSDIQKEVKSHSLRETGRRCLPWAEHPGRRSSGAAAVGRRPCERHRPGTQGLFSPREQGEVTWAACSQPLLRGRHRSSRQICTPVGVSPRLSLKRSLTPFFSLNEASQAGNVNIFEKQVGQGMAKLRERGVVVWGTRLRLRLCCVPASRTPWRLPGTARGITWGSLHCVPKPATRRLAQLCCPFHGSAG